MAGKEAHDWKPLTSEELQTSTQFYLQFSAEALAHKCAVLTHRLTKYEGVPDKEDDNGNPEQEFREARKGDQEQAEIDYSL